MSRVEDRGGAWQIGVAEGGWWAAERAKLIAERLGPTIRAAALAVDLGCGRGEGVDLLVQEGASYVVGVDAEPFPTWDARRGRAALVCADLGRLPFRPGVADVVSAFDVIEHFADDGVALDRVREIARPSAVVAVTVPAHPALWSPFDDVVGHHRRYTTEGLLESLRRAGLEPQDVTHFFSWLAIPAYLLRRRDRSGIDDAEGIAGRAGARVASLLCRLERAVLRRRSIALGTSLWVRSTSVAR